MKDVVGNEASWWPDLTFQEYIPEITEYIPSIISAPIETTTNLIPELGVRNIIGSYFTPEEEVSDVQETFISLELMEANALPEDTNLPMILKNKTILRLIISWMEESDIIKLGQAFSKFGKPLYRLAGFEEVLIFPDYNYVIFKYDEEICLSIAQRRFCAEASRNKAQVVDIDDNTCEIFANRARLPDAFVILKKNGRCFAFGDTKSGGDAKMFEMELIDIVNVHSTLSAFCVVKNNGELICWGNPSEGGKCSSENVNEENYLINVKKVESTLRAFAALHDDGSVTAWGDCNFGGRAPENVFDVCELEGNMRAFLCEKNDGEFLSWGDPAYLPKEKKPEFNFDELLRRKIN